MMESQEVTLTCDIDNKDNLDFQIQDDELWICVMGTNFSVRATAEQLPPLIKLLTEFAQFKGVEV